MADTAACLQLVWELSDFCPKELNRFSEGILHWTWASLSKHEGEDNQFSAPSILFQKRWYENKLVGALSPVNHRELHQG